MKPGDLDLVIRILALIHAVSAASLRAVPVPFRPAGIQEKLDEVADLLDKLRKSRA